MKPAHDPTDIETLNQRLDQLMSQHHELFERLKQGQQHFQRLARSVWRVQEEERRRLARELHDGIGQNLTALIRQLDTALAMLPPDATAARARIEQACALNHATLEDTRALSRLLRPQILDDLGLEAALSWLARTIGEHHGLHVVLSVSRSLPPLDSDLSTLIFRVVQEALTNVVKHASAANAEVSLRVDRDSIELRVDDDGRGCETDAALASSAQGHSSGLGGMRDRVHLFSGEFRLDSTPGSGCRIVLRLPLPTEGVSPPP